MTSCHVKIAVTARWIGHVKVLGSSLHVLTLAVFVSWGGGPSAVRRNAIESPTHHLPNDQYMEWLCKATYRVHSVVRYPTSLLQGLVLLSVLPNCPLPKIEN